MKLTLPASVFADAVAWAARTLPQRPTIPVLAGLLLDADPDGTLTIGAFDYDLSAKATVQADVAEPGRILVSGRLLAQIVASLPDKPVELSTSGAEVELRCGPAEFGLTTMPVEDYPALPEPPATLGQVDAALLRAALAQVVPAASPDETLIMLTGVRIDLDADGIEMAATDRYRLAARALPWQPTAHTADIGVLVPAKALKDVGKGFADGPVGIGADSSQFALTSAGRQIIVRLLDSEFVNYRANLANVTAPITARVDVAPLVEAIKRVALVAERNTPVRLAFTTGQVEVSAGGGDLGRGSEAVACILDGADEVTVAFLPAFLLDGVHGVAGDVVTISMPESHGRVLIGGDDPEYRYLTLPLRQS
ncbi:DNA polymerase III subunit beta [Nonomuraea sp. NPDC050790]|uniref:DNA polymerase III subunit beta n=1 Tax=Nonomuraea sp. NPDC050790 TaxID=3364371 RepID=UPI00379C8454